MEPRRFIKTREGKIPGLKVRYRKGMFIVSVPLSQLSKKARKGREFTEGLRMLGTFELRTTIRITGNPNQAIAEARDRVKKILEETFDTRITYRSLEDVIVYRINKSTIRVRLIITARPVALRLKILIALTQRAHLLRRMDSYVQTKRKRAFRKLLQKKITEDEYEAIKALEKKTLELAKEATRYSKEYAKRYHVRDPYEIFERGYIELLSDAEPLLLHYPGDMRYLPRLRVERRKRYSTRDDVPIYYRRDRDASIRWGIFGR